jgi:hypothetical protein
MKLLLLALTACALHAAVIRGTAVEHQTGKFLSRVLVTVQPIGGTAFGTTGGAISTRTNTLGLFEFSSLPAGAYVVKASRLGFMPVESGQKRWNSAGLPVFLEDNGTAFLALRLPRWGAISGTVVDENDIGLPEHDVVAYRNTRPPQLIAHAKSDERGVYRISGLEPGAYIVRTTGAQYEEGSYLPTFSKESIPVDSARFVEVDLDQQVNNVDVRPLPGKLFTISGSVIADPPDADPPVQTLVTLATEMGRQNFVVTSGDFRFTGAAPGPYELYAQAPADNNPQYKLQGWYISSILREDTIYTRIANSVTREITFEFRGAPTRALESGTMQLLARRKDFAGEGPTEVVKPVNNRVPVPPGRWEFMLVPPPGYCVTDFSGRRQMRGDKSRADGWNEIQVTGSGDYVRFTLSNSPSSLSGVVKNGSEPAIGAPVFLEAWDPVTRQRLLDLRSTLTGMNGQYSFKDLAPGAYRVLATFEYRNPDSGVLDAAGAPSLTIEPRGGQQRDLDLYIIR